MYSYSETLLSLLFVYLALVRCTLTEVPPQYERLADVVKDHIEDPCYGDECEQFDRVDRDYLKTDFGGKIYSKDDYDKEKQKLIEKGLTELSIKLGSAQNIEDYTDDVGLDLSMEQDSKGYKNKYHDGKRPGSDSSGWVTLEAVPWSVSKVSKWKPNQQKPQTSVYDEGEPLIETYAGTIGVNSAAGNKKHPPRPTTTVWNTNNYGSNDNVPSMPFTSSWNPDDSRRPTNCPDSTHNHYDYGNEGTTKTPVRLPLKPYVEYEQFKRPYKIPTESYSGTYDESDRETLQPTGDGHWILLSTTKGYNKRRHRSMNVDKQPVMTRTHRAVVLTVLPVDKGERNMTTSHGGLLEVEKTFKTVDESKNDFDKNANLGRVKNKKVLRQVNNDGSEVFAAVGAGMVPATMALVMPMVLGKRRRKRHTVPKQMKESYMPVMIE